ncbi:MAG TPA: class II aldolase/adducin family protein, partial [Thermoanaerobaculia bacterium]
MESRWSDVEAERHRERWAGRWGEDLALRAYSARLLGADPSLVLHGGGNTSLKGTTRDLFGDERPALFVKASGRDLAAAGPADHVALDLAALRRLVAEVAVLDDPAAARALALLRFDPEAAAPSIEAAVHAVLPGRFVDHTHADAVLALTNRPDGEAVVRAALGDEVLVLPYTEPGHPLARAVAAALAERPAARAMVWLRHGVVTWGDGARESYERMVELVARAEEYLAGEARRRRGAASGSGPGREPRDEGGAAAEGTRAGAGAEAASAAPPEVVAGRLAALAPALRGLLSPPTGDPDRPWRRVVLQAATDAATIALLAEPGMRERAVTPP